MYCTLYTLYTMYTLYTLYHTISHYITIQQYTQLHNRTWQDDIWKEDLDALEVALDDYEECIEQDKKRETAARKKAKSDRNTKGQGKVWISV